MVLLSLVGVDPEVIVDDHLEPVRLGDTRTASAHRNNDEALIEELRSRRGMTTEQAVRHALAGLGTTAFLRAAAVSDDVRAVLRTSRGHRPSAGRA